MATSWNCPVLKSEVVSPSPALVWQTVGGDTEGALIKPIHQSVPLAASRDTLLYQVMSLVEAIRGGKPRELAIARELLTDLIKGK
jgi:hypothetical protein